MEHVSFSPDGMVEYWNVGLNKEFIHFIASLSRGILPMDQYPIFPPSRCSGQDHPLFQHSTIPIVSEAN
jgi:hypothetical protein